MLESGPSLDAIVLGAGMDADRRVPSASTAIALIRKFWHVYGTENERALEAENWQFEQAKRRSEEASELLLPQSATERLVQAPFESPVKDTEPLMALEQREDVVPLS